MPSEKPLSILRWIFTAIAELAELQRDLLLVLDDVQTVVDDFDPMRARVGELIEELTSSAAHVPEVSESLEFLRWIYNGYFTFLGCAEFDLVERQ